MDEEEGIIIGKVEILHDEMKMNDMEISQKLEIPIEKVKEIIEELDL